MKWPFFCRPSFGFPWHQHARKYVRGGGGGAAKRGDDNKSSLLKSGFLPWERGARRERVANSHFFFRARLAFLDDGPKLSLSFSLPSFLLLLLFSIHLLGGEGGGGVSVWPTYPLPLLLSPSTKATAVCHLMVRNSPISSYKMPNTKILVFFGQNLLTSLRQSLTFRRIPPFRTPRRGGKRKGGKRKEGREEEKGAAINVSDLSSVFFFFFFHIDRATPLRRGTTLSFSIPSPLTPPFPWEYKS